MSYTYREFESGNYDVDEVAAVRATLDAIATGMSHMASSVNQDGSMPPDDEAAIGRLQKVLNALNDIYTRDVIDELYEELMAVGLSDAEADR